ncbi:sugar transferase [Thermanaerothrix sp. 4228-RoL]|uniref:Sugar transferase n=1 Tax=Thermanaerothrix solaris TaxID=3058434 RepID=A0ABU3NL23_9CHLR|nr:sugar transferase [Thermanaerothrix sp. 4228-RoL]MDT8896672.1 sugar transferase [Thermanaerothrix sp. 4228-RoL]
MSTEPDLVSIQPKWRLRPSERRSTLFIGDLLIAVGSLVFALYFWASGGEFLSFSTDFLRYRVPFWFYLLPVVWLLMLVESYNPSRVNIRSEAYREVTVAAIAGFAFYLIVFFFSEPNSLPRRGVAAFFASAYVLTLLWRFIYIKLFTLPLFMRRVLIIGAGRAGSHLAQIIRDMWPPPFYLVGLVDDDPDKIGTEIAGFRVLGSGNDIFRLIREHQVTDLVIAISGEMNPQLFATLLEAEEQGIEVTTMPTLYEELLGRVPIFLLQSDWVLRSFVDQAHMGGFFELSKRLLDILGGLIGTLLMLMLFPLIALAIYLESGRPIFYTQTRLGKNGRPYKIIKFRTMVQDAEKDGIPRTTAENDQRTTKVGRFLRRSHLDELPQFINVLRGEMSLVGPRSERPEIVQEYQKALPFYRARLFVKPGITGWAQVNFGYAEDVRSNAIKLEYDLYYIKHRSLTLDLLILIRTVGTVIGLKGR